MRELGDKELRDWEAMLSRAIEIRCLDYEEILEDLGTNAVGVKIHEILREEYSSLDDLHFDVHCFYQDEDGIHRPMCDVVDESNGVAYEFKTKEPGLIERVKTPDGEEVDKLEKYLRGLNGKSEIGSNIQDGVLVYIDRGDLQTQNFPYRLGEE